jgi:hypothetical protein
MRRTSVRRSSESNCGNTAVGEFLQRHLCHPKRDSKPSAGVTPAGEGIIPANNVTGTAFQTTIVNKGHFLVLFIPGVTGCWTTVGAGTLITLLTDIFIELNVWIPINTETGVIENLFEVNFHRALHPP